MIIISVKSTSIINLKRCIASVYLNVATCELYKTNNIFLISIEILLVLQVMRTYDEF